VAVDTLTGGSFDDLPDAELRTVLSVPLALPGAAPGLASRAETTNQASPPEPPAPAARRHRSPRAGKPRSAAVETVRIGLFAAVTVVVLVVVALLAVDRLVR
jgi:hypothetical protein